MRVDRLFHGNCIELVFFGKLGKRNHIARQGVAHDIVLEDISLALKSRSVLLFVSRQAVCVFQMFGNGGKRAARVAQIGDHCALLLCERKGLVFVFQKERLCFERRLAEARLDALRELAVKGIEIAAVQGIAIVMLCFWHAAYAPDGLHLESFVHIFTQFDENMRPRAVPARRDGLLDDDGNLYAVVVGDVVEVFMPLRKPYGERACLVCNALAFKKLLHRVQKQVGIVG